MVSGLAKTRSIQHPSWHFRFYPKAPHHTTATDLWPGLARHPTTARLCAVGLPSAIPPDHQAGCKHPGCLGAGSLQPGTSHKAELDRWRRMDASQGTGAKGTLKSTRAENNEKLKAQVLLAMEHPERLGDFHSGWK